VTDKNKDKKPTAYKLVRENKKAFHTYEILDRFEAGISLVGTEVKSIREGHVSVDQAYVKLRGPELFVIGMNVMPYTHAGMALNHDPIRPRKLLLHKQEIRKIASRIKERGFTVVPLKMYFNERGLLKVEIALARGKTKYDKREAIKKRESDRQLKRYKK
jgi:SsrA-binding protein